MNRGEAYRIYMAEMLRISAMDIRGREGLPRFYELLHPVDVRNADPGEIIDRITTGINSL